MTTGPKVLPDVAESKQHLPDTTEYGAIEY
jgi:hypothetical protein